MDLTADLELDPSLNIFVSQLGVIHIWSGDHWHWKQNGEKAERRNNRIWAYLSFIQCKNFEIVRNPYVILISWFKTKISFKDFELVHSRSLRSTGNKSIAG